MERVGHEVPVPESTTRAGRLSKSNIPQGSLYKFVISYPQNPIVIIEAPCIRAVTWVSCYQALKQISKPILFLRAPYSNSTFQEPKTLF